MAFAAGMMRLLQAGGASPFDQADPGVQIQAHLRLHTVIASAGDLTEQVTFNHVSQPDPAYRFQQGTVLNWFDIDTPEGFYSIKDLLKDISQSSDAMALVQPFLAEMMAARAAKAAQKEKKTGRETVKSGAGMSAEDRRRTTMQFSLLQLIRMSAPDMPKERIIAMNRKLNQIRKEN